MQVYQKILLQIVVIALFVVSGALLRPYVMRITDGWKSGNIIWRIILSLYLMVIAYITIFSRTVSSGNHVEFRIFRFLYYGVDLVLKFLESCITFVVYGTWKNVERPDINIPYIQEGILNILLFVPLGYLLPTAMAYRGKYKIGKIVVIGFLISLLIEIVQVVARIGIFDLDDLINNTLGTLLGMCLFTHCIVPSCMKKGKEN